jgi:hypothetical protein
VVVLFAAFFATGSFLWRRKVAAAAESVAPTSRGGATEEFSFPYYRWGCWLMGVDTVAIDGARVTVTTRRGVTCCCCVPGALKSKTAEGTVGRVSARECVNLMTNVARVKFSRFARSGGVTTNMTLMIRPASPLFFSLFVQFFFLQNFVTRSSRHQIFEGGFRRNGVALN